MNRLTKRIDGKLVFPNELIGVMMTPSNDAMYQILTRLAAYEDTGLEPEQVLELKSFTQGGIHKTDDGWKHVQELLRAEQEGRMVVLPCKVGDTVYRVLTTRDCPPVISEVKIKTVGQAADLIGRMGKRKLLSYYLTREEAEAALAKKGGEG